MARKNSKKGKKSQQKSGRLTVVKSFSDAKKLLHAQAKERACTDPILVPVELYESEYIPEATPNESFQYSSNEQHMGIFLSEPESDVAQRIKMLANSWISKKHDPGTSINVMIAGATYYGGFYEGVVLFCAEPENPYDPNAIKVCQNGQMVGHIPRIIVSNAKTRALILSCGSGLIDSKGMISINAMPV